ncbi:MAG: hypothetical protein U0559_00410 [Anaerolineae bacterium]
MNDITATDLRFSSAETLAFLRHTVRAPISPDVAARAETENRTGRGFAFGVAGTAKQTDPREAEQILATFSGDTRSVLDYLTSEVLATLPATSHRSSFFCRPVFSIN